MGYSTSKIKPGILTLTIICFLVCVSGCSAKDDKIAETESLKDSEGLAETDMTEDMDFPEDCYVTWAVPDDMVQVSDDTIRAINKKLKEDGSAYGLKLMPLESASYKDALSAADADANADIAFVGLDFEKRGLALEGIENGEYECLDSYLTDSKLYDAIPKLLWDGISFHDHVYYVPNESAQDGGISVFFRKDLFSEKQITEFDGNIFSLRKYLSSDVKMCYSVSSFKYAETFGYVFDASKGLLFTKEGTCLNPFEIEECRKWLTELKNWQEEGVVTDKTKEMDACGIVLSSGSLLHNNENWAEYSWPGYVFDRLTAGTGIRAASKKKEAAFQMLERFHTDHEYGNLLVFGVDSLKTDIPNGHSNLHRLVFGLDTGLKWGEEGMYFYSSIKEKKDYYEEQLNPSPSMGMEFPKEQCQELVDLEMEYGSICFEDDFEQRLEEYEQKLGKVYAKVLETMN